MTFIMGNAYQSLIISSMSFSREGVRIKTFEELFSSESKFIVDPILYDKLASSGEFASILKRMEYALGFPEYKQFAKEKYSVIAQCDMLDFMLNVQTEENVAEYFYMLPDKWMAFYDSFYINFRSPFYEKLQEGFNNIHETGIRQHWKHLLEEKKAAQLDRNKNYLKNEEYFLTYDDIYGVFYILFAGYALSLIAFLLEIAFHLFIQIKNYKKWFKVRSKHKQQKRPKKKVRRVQVRPIEL